MAFLILQGMALLCLPVFSMRQSDASVQGSLDRMIMCNMTFYIIGLHIQIYHSAYMFISIIGMFYVVIPSDLETLELLPSGLEMTFSENLE